jgi:hypothetical protein
MAPLVWTVDAGSGAAQDSSSGSDMSVRSPDHPKAGLDDFRQTKSADALSQKIMGGPFLRKGGAKQAVLRNRLGQPKQARHRAFLLGQEGRTDRPGGVVERDDEIKIAAAGVSRGLSVTNPLAISACREAGPQRRWRAAPANWATAGNRVGRDGAQLPSGRKRNRYLDEPAPRAPVQLISAVLKFR